jgi:hypothetical protein
MDLTNIVYEGIDRILLAAITSTAMKLRTL